MQGVLNFSVDAALLRELGERLVGNAHVALGELIKNSYDADARNCEIVFDVDNIILADDGHGMTIEDFTRYWMRVGTTHKATQEKSPKLKRPLTGSKGVGRLAVQFLAKNLVLETRVQGSQDLLKVIVDWPQTIRAGQLVEAEVRYSVEQVDTTFANGATHGTKLVLTGLNHQWDHKLTQAVAREIWALVPPFVEMDADPRSFRVSVESHSGNLVSDQFDQQLNAALEQWIAKIDGEILGGRANALEKVTVTFSDGETHTETFPLEECLLDQVRWDVKIYNLRGRLAHDIPVQEAREYLERFGGVHVYDGAFRLPYYGVGQDWLSLEFDHSHRRVKSKLLPDSLHVERALNDLPTQGRLYGNVYVNTGLEKQHAAGLLDSPAGVHLQIQVTRDRLVFNQAFEQLRDAVRRSIDYYATRSMLRRIQRSKADRPSVSPAAQVRKIETVIDTYEGAIPADVYQALKSEIVEFVDVTEREHAYIDSIQQLLGPLASAGMAALALEHETNRELLLLGNIADRLENSKSKSIDPKVLAMELRAWVDRVRSTREIFSPLLSEEDRTAGHRLLVGKVVEKVIASTAAFTEGVEIEVDVPRDVRFPKGSVADWSAILQNVLINAVNAAGDNSGSLSIWVTAGVGPGRAEWLRVSDTGRGISLIEADKLFDPFRRQVSLAAGQRRLGLGGLGLGLTIVRMIADSRSCKVSFTVPEPGFNTTFEMSWS